MTTTDVYLDQLSRLVAAGRTRRDQWLPVAGRVDSGFQPDAEAVTDLTHITGGDPPSETKALRRLLDDPHITAAITGTADYPIDLAQIHGRPAVIYINGSLPAGDCPAIAIVGSRNPTDAGLHAAHQIAAQLAQAGHPIVSGLAAGIDTAAHHGALDAGGSTVAVMGTGLGKVFPPDHASLADQITVHGALVTQFPPRWGPTKTTFPARNALIAALSQISVLIESAERSGTMIEANCALAQGRTVALWHPLLAGREWAHRFATLPRVVFVDSAEEIAAIAQT